MFGVDIVVMMMVNCDDYGDSNGRDNGGYSGDHGGYSGDNDGRL